MSLLSKDDEEFNGNTYKAGHSLAALIGYNGSFVEMKVTSKNGHVDNFDYEVLTDKEQLNARFEEWLDCFLEKNNPRVYLITEYQMKKYPFISEENTIKDIDEMMQWVCKNLKEDEQITIVDPIVDYTKEIIIKRNDIGVSVDYYSDNSCEPVHISQYCFDDFENVSC